jgi:hypothetical protein
MDERVCRLWAATEAQALGWGGIAALARATGLSRPTIQAGLQDLQFASPPNTTALDPQRVRRPGGGRKPLTHTNPRLLRALQALLEATTRGDPQSPLLWTCKSCRNLADELTRQGHPVSYHTVSTLLHQLDYSLQANRKTHEGADHPDRDAQFRYINRQVKAFLRRGQPAVSVDTKKKELLGDFKNGGREWRPAGQPEEVRVHDFPDKELGKAIPYGVYDIGRDEGWVSVGIDHDTAEFAVQTLRRWWREMGQWVYPEAEELLIAADSGGSNGSRSRLWKVCVQGLADDVQLRIRVCHFPPGTSKWNQIEHRMFCHITQNWRGRPLVSRQAVVELIGHTKTQSGLQIQAGVDTKAYPTGIKVSDEELAAVNLRKARFHGDWNYTIMPNP